MTKIASIDIGSNTVRLLIFSGAPDTGFETIDSERAITRLGEAMDQERKLQERRVEDTLEVLQRFKKKCSAHGDIPIHAVATSAVREASNREEFVRRAREQAGIEVKVIPWEEEARLTLEGVFWKIPDQGKNTLTFDIGGGSTEYIFSQGKTLLAAHGTSLGVVRLTEKFITRHPVDTGEYLKLQTFLREGIQEVKTQLPDLAPERLIGTAGTVTTLAALANNIYPYDAEKIHGAVLSQDQIQSIQEDLMSRSNEERLLLKALEKGREDLIIAGAALTLETMRIFGCEHLTVSEYSLREGILISLSM